MPLFDLKKLNASLPPPSVPRNSVNILVMGASDDFIVVSIRWILIPSLASFGVCWVIRHELVHQTNKMLQACRICLWKYMVLHKCTVTVTPMQYMQVHDLGKTLDVMSACGLEILPVTLGCDEPMWVRGFTSYLLNWKIWCTPARTMDCGPTSTNPWLAWMSKALSQAGRTWWFSPCLANKYTLD